MRAKKLLSAVGLCLFFATFYSCATYTTPAGGVDIADMTDESIAEMMQIEPAAPFPARLAIVRVQAAGYVSRTNRGYGDGKYSVVTTRDIEKEADFERIGQLPMVAGVAPLNRILLPSLLDSLKDLRRAAAKLKTDMLLMYTLDTTFHVETTSLGPLSTVTLGFLPNKEARVTATTSGALIDVRTGFVYGVAESSATEKQRANMWSTQDAIDSSRLEAEAASFQSFLLEFEKLWQNVVEQYAKQKT